MSLKNNVLSGLRWTLVAKLGNQLVSWACTLVVIRLLHPDDYGLMAMATTFISVCVMVNEMGLSQALVQAKTVSERELRQTFGLVVLLNGGFFLLFCLVAPLIAGFFGEPRLKLLLPALAIQFLLLIFFAIPNALLDRDMAFRYKSINEVIAVTAGSLATLVLAWLGYGVWALVWGNLLALLIRIICMNIVRPFLMWPSFDFSGYSGFAKIGGYITLNRILWYVHTQADMLIVGKLLGKTTLGYYAVAMQLASLPLQKVAVIVGTVGHAAYSRLQEQRQLAGSYALKSASVMAFACFPVFFGLSAVSHEIIALVGGPKWASAVLPMQLLALIFPLRALNLVLTPLASGLGRPDITSRSLAVAAVMLPFAFYLGARLDGLRGVCLAWVLVFPVWSLFAMNMTLRLVDLRLRDFVRVSAWPACASAVMYALVMALREALLPMPELPRLALLALSGAGFYAGVMWGLRRDACRELLRQIRQSP